MGARRGSPDQARLDHSVRLMGRPQFWPCRCGAPGTRNLGADGYCGRHLSELVAGFKEHNFDGIGVGLCHDDPPIFDGGAVYLRCNLCPATWLGRVLDRCDWCAHAVLQQRVWQAELVRRVPEVDRDDVSYENAMRAWGQRLATAVLAGLIDQHQARRAWHREVNHDHIAA